MKCPMVSIKRVKHICAVPSWSFYQAIADKNGKESHKSKQNQSRYKKVREWSALQGIGRHLQQTAIWRN